MTDPTPGLLDEAAETTTHTEPVEWTLVTYSRTHEGQVWPAELVDGWVVPNQALYVPAGSTVAAYEDGRHLRAYSNIYADTTVHGLGVSHGQVR